MSGDDTPRRDSPIAWGGTAIGILGIVLAAILLPASWIDLILLVILAGGVVGAVWYWHRHQTWLDRKFFGIVLVAVVPLLLLVRGRLPDSVPPATATATPSTAAVAPSITSTSNATATQTSSPTLTPSPSQPTPTVTATEVPTATATPELFDELRAGMNIEFAEQRLGTAIAVNAAGEHTVKLYRNEENDRWIQIVHDDVGQMLLLAVTACDRADRMSIIGPDGHELVLNQTTFENAGVGSAMAVGTPSYRIGANSFFAFEGRFYGNVSGYKSWMVGTSDLCVSTGIDTWTLREGMTRTAVGEAPGSSPQDDWYSDPAIAAFRSTTPINVYAETSSSTGLEQLKAYELVGSLRYTVRGLPSTK